MSTAQGGGRIELELYGGLAIPVAPDPFSQGWNAGLSIGLGVGFALDHFAISGQVSSSRFGFDEEGARNFMKGATNEPQDDESVRVLIASVNADFILLGRDSQIRPYFTVGVGYSRVSSNPIGLRDATNELVGVIGQRPGNGFAAMLGLGVDFGVRENLRAFVEGQYVISIVTQETFFLEENTQFVPVVLGLRLAL